MRDDVAVLEREDVEGAQEFFELEDERHGQRSPAPARRQRRAPGQVVERQPVDQRQRMHRRGGAVCVSRP